MELAYQQILAALGDAQEPLRARDLCRLLDLPLVPKHIESARYKLKRLVSKGLVTEKSQAYSLEHKPEYTSGHAISKPHSAQRPNGHRRTDRPLSLRFEVGGIDSWRPR
jgi:hypothetical protein